MGWLNRMRGRAPSAPVAAAPTAVVRAAPGIVRLLEGVVEDGEHAVLDLGAAFSSSLRVYARFARRVRFADALDGAAVVDRLPAQPERPYDLIFAWDALSRLAPAERPRLAARLAEITGPRARLHAVLESSERAPSRPLRFRLEGPDRMRYEPSDAAVPTLPCLLPAEVERVLAPFEILRAFTLKDGLREYVAVRKG